MTRTLNKPIIYSAVICGSVLVWHLFWLAFFGSPIGILEWLNNHRWPESYGDLEDSSAWFRNYVLFYFVLLPLVIFAFAMVFAWNERAFRKEYPGRFMAVMLAALSPGVYVAVLAYLSTCLL